MRIRRIIIDEEFVAEFNKLPAPIQRRADKAREFFLNDPFHPSLRLHKLSGKLDGYWSISVTHRYRILFVRKEDGDVLFFSIGTHAIYD